MTDLDTKIGVFAKKKINLNAIKQSANLVLVVIKIDKNNISRETILTQLGIILVLLQVDMVKFEIQYPDIVISVIQPL